METYLCYPDCDRIKCRDCSHLWICAAYIKALRECYDELTGGRNEAAREILIDILDATEGGYVTDNALRALDEGKPAEALCYIDRLIHPMPMKLIAAPSGGAAS